MRVAGTASSDPLRVRDRLVTINSGVLSQQLAPQGSDVAADRAAQSAALGGVVQIELFPGTTFTFSRTSVTAADLSGVAWAGSASNKEIQEAMLIVDNGTITGRIQANNKLYKIQHVSGAVHRITEINQLAIPPEAQPLVRPGLQAGDQQQNDTPVGPQANTIIKVLAVYTPAARTQAGGTTQIINEIKSAVALANQAYTRGNIMLTVSLAGTPMQVTYTDAADISTDLNNLTSGSQFAGARSQRVSRKADLVSLFRKYNSSFCGIAWLPGSGSMPTPSAATRNLGYSVMVRDCISNLSFHHEMGHNEGLRHDRFVDPGHATSFYNFGYVNKPARQRTVMAYNNACVASGFNCTRINWFSSRTIRATGSVVIGNAQNDNTRRLITTKTPVSQYYTP